MKTNERFLAALRQMNTVMKEDVKAGRKWRYSNSSAKQEHTFDKARSTGKRFTNCVLAVWWALRMAGVPDLALHWMGGIGKIIWTTSTAKENAKKYFDIINTGGHSVSYLWDHQLLCDGDVLLGFQSMNHTCVFYGGSTGKKSFDSGHSNCSGSGELAEFKRWISALTSECRPVLSLILTSTIRRRRKSKRRDSLSHGLTKTACTKSKSAFTLASQTLIGCVTRQSPRVLVLSLRRWID